MKNKYTIWYTTAIIAVALFTGSCSQHGHNEGDHDQSEATESKPDEETGNNEDGADAKEEAISESTVWTPNGSGPELLQSDFHYLTGTTENISPEVIKDTDAKDVLQLTADGTSTAFVFHSSYGNIGMAVLLNVKDFVGSIKLIHHALNIRNYEFVSINSGNMKLGRVVEGRETIFDEDGFNIADDWINLRVSAAGTHFKGYIGGKSITHGHGDKMKDGYVGILIEGTGTVLIKSIEVLPLENE